MDALNTSTIKRLYTPFLSNFNIQTKEIYVLKTPKTLKTNSSTCPDDFQRHHFTDFLEYKRSMTCLQAPHSNYVCKQEIHTWHAKKPFQWPVTLLP